MSGVFVDGVQAHHLSIDAVVELESDGQITLACSTPLMMTPIEAQELIQTLIDAVRTQQPHKRLMLFL